MASVRSVHTTAKNLPASEPTVTKRSSPYLGDGYVYTGRPSNNGVASIKSRPWSRKFMTRSFSSHSKVTIPCIHSYVHTVYTSERQGEVAAGRQKSIGTGSVSRSLLEAQVAQTLARLVGLVCVHHEATGYVMSAAISDPRCVLVEDEALDLCRLKRVACYRDHGRIEVRKHLDQLVGIRNQQAHFSVKPKSFRRSRASSASSRCTIKRTGTPAVVPNIRDDAASKMYDS